MDDLRELLVCPACRGRLEWRNGQTECAACAHLYPIGAGILILLPHAGEAEPTSSHSHETSANQQRTYYDREADDDFEITRPHGTPALYRWLLDEKFRRAIGPIRDRVPGATALAVCGGSGMDAEYLARAGARVITADISSGAARRARERARRHQIPITSIVADVEHLPFADKSIDLVYVHDGLHHLEDPLKGLTEMARVARWAVSVTEPAGAAVTRAAVRLRLAREWEEAGNRVARLSVDEATGVLRSAGYRVSRAERYAMYYRHAPGPIFQRLSMPLVFPLMILGWKLANLVAGRWGNKLVVIGER